MMKTPLWLPPRYGGGPRATERGGERERERERGEKTQDKRKKDIKGKESNRGRDEGGRRIRKREKKKRHRAYCPTSRKKGIHHVDARVGGGGEPVGACV